MINFIILSNKVQSETFGEIESKISNILILQIKIKSCINKKKIKDRRPLCFEGWRKCVKNSPYTFLTATIVQDLSKPSILQLFKKDPLQIWSVQNHLLLTNVKCKCHGNILHKVVDSFNHPEIGNDFQFSYDIFQLTQTILTPSFLFQLTNFHRVFSLPLSHSLITYKLISRTSLSRSFQSLDGK